MIDRATFDPNVRIDTIMKPEDTVGPITCGAVPHCLTHCGTDSFPGVVAVAPVGQYLH
ncbi:MAG: hypothetical protein HXS40_11115 [Theionarchaea archaeon]|nr:hypothetical protein [Theionarchaea archaeon]